MQLLLSAPLTACNCHVESTNYSSNSRDNLKLETHLPFAFLSALLLPPSAMSQFDSKSKLTFGDAAGCKNSAIEHVQNIINPKRAHISLTEET